MYNTIKNEKYEYLNTFNINFKNLISLLFFELKQSFSKHMTTIQLLKGHD